MGRGRGRGGEEDGEGGGEEDGGLIDGRGGGGEKRDVTYVFWPLFGGVGGWGWWLWKLEVEVVRLGEEERVEGLGMERNGNKIGQ